MTKQTNGINDTYSSNSTDTSGFGSKDIRDIDEATMNLYFADKLSDDEIACKYGDESAIQVFRTACVYGQIEVVENLLNRGFDPNTPVQYHSMNSAISIAYFQGHSDTARFLLEHGAKINDSIFREIKIANVLFKNATKINDALLNECKVSDFNNAKVTDRVFNEVKKCYTVDIVAGDTTTTGNEVGCSGELSSYQVDELDIL